jgi:hypothetical protein
MGNTVGTGCLGSLDGIEVMRLSKLQIAVVSILGGVGIVLLLINFAGLLIPLGNPAIYTEPWIWSPPEPIMTEAEFYKAIEWNGESDAEYAMKVNDAVYNGIAHYWFDEGTEKYNLRLPIQENWLIYLMDGKTKYEFQDWKRSIERGAGLCGERAMDFVAIMKLHNIEAHVLAFDGHVVATAQIDKENNTWWVLGPDYNVVIEHSPSEIAANPNYAVQAYLDAGYNKNIANFMGEIWAEGWNDSYCDGALMQRLKKEGTLYFLKWAIPISLIVIPLLAVWMEILVK